MSFTSIRFVSLSGRLLSVVDLAALPVGPRSPHSGGSSQLNGPPLDAAVLEALQQARSARHNAPTAPIGAKKGISPAAAAEAPVSKGRFCVQQVLLGSVRELLDYLQSAVFLQGRPPPRPVSSAVVGAGGAGGAGGPGALYVAVLQCPSKAVLDALVATPTGSFQPPARANLSPSTGPVPLTGPNAHLVATDQSAPAVAHIAAQDPTQIPPVASAETNHSGVFDAEGAVADAYHRALYGDGVGSVGDGSQPAARSNECSRMLRLWSDELQSLALQGAVGAAVRRASQSASAPSRPAPVLSRLLAASPAVQAIAAAALASSPPLHAHRLRAVLAVVQQRCPCGRCLAATAGAAPLSPDFFVPSNAERCFLWDVCHAHAEDTALALNTLGGGEPASGDDARPSTAASDEQGDHVSGREAGARRWWWVQRHLARPIPLATLLLTSHVALLPAAVVHGEKAPSAEPTPTSTGPGTPSLDDERPWARWAAHTAPQLHAAVEAATLATRMRCLASSWAWDTDSEPVIGAGVSVPPPPSDLPSFDPADMEASRCCGPPLDFSAFRAEVTAILEAMFVRSLRLHRHVKRAPAPAKGDAAAGAGDDAEGDDFSSASDEASRDDNDTRTLVMSALGPTESSTTAQQDSHPPTPTRIRRSHASRRKSSSSPTAAAGERDAIREADAVLITLFVTTIGYHYLSRGGCGGPMLLAYLHYIQGYVNLCRYRIALAATTTASGPLAIALPLAGSTVSGLHCRATAATVLALSAILDYYNYFHCSTTALVVARAQSTVVTDAVPPTAATDSSSTADAGQGPQKTRMHIVKYNTLWSLCNEPSLVPAAADTGISGTLGPGPHAASAVCGPGAACPVPSFIASGGLWRQLQQSQATRALCGNMLFASHGPGDEAERSPPLHHLPPLPADHGGLSNLLAPMELHAVYRCLAHLQSSAVGPACSPPPFVVLQVDVVVTVGGEKVLGIQQAPTAFCGGPPDAITSFAMRAADVGRLATAGDLSVLTALVERPLVEVCALGAATSACLEDACRQSQEAAAGLVERLVAAAPLQAALHRHLRQEGLACAQTAANLDDAEGRFIDRNYIFSDRFEPLSDGRVDAPAPTAVATAKDETLTSPARILVHMRLELPTAAAGPAQVPPQQDPAIGVGGPTPPFAIRPHRGAYAELFMAAAEVHRLLNVAHTRAFSLRRALCAAATGDTKEQHPLRKDGCLDTTTATSDADAIEPSPTTAFRRPHPPAVRPGTPMSGEVPPTRATRRHPEGGGASPMGLPVLAAAASPRPSASTVPQPAVLSLNTLVQSHAGTGGGVQLLPLYAPSSAAEPPALRLLRLAKGLPSADANTVRGAAALVRYAPLIDAGLGGANSFLTAAEDLFMATALRGFAVPPARSRRSVPDQPENVAPVPRLVPGVHHAATDSDVFRDHRLEPATASRPPKGALTQLLAARFSIDRLRGPAGGRRNRPCTLTPADLWSLHTDFGLYGSHESREGVRRVERLASELATSFIERYAYVPGCAVGPAFAAPSGPITPFFAVATSCSGGTTRSELHRLPPEAAPFLTSTPIHVHAALPAPPSADREAHRAHPLDAMGVLEDALADLEAQRTAYQRLLRRETHRDRAAGAAVVEASKAALHAALERLLGTHRHSLQLWEDTMTQGARALLDPLLCRVARHSPRLQPPTLADLVFPRFHGADVSAPALYEGPTITFITGDALDIPLSLPLLEFLEDAFFATQVLSGASEEELRDLRRLQRRPDANQRQTELAPGGSPPPTASPPLLASPAPPRLRTGFSSPSTRHNIIAADRLAMRVADAQKRQTDRPAETIFEGTFGLLPPAAHRGGGGGARRRPSGRPQQAPQGQGTIHIELQVGDSGGADPEDLGRLLEQVLATALNDNAVQASRPAGGSSQQSALARLDTVLFSEPSDAEAAVFNAPDDDECVVDSELAEATRRRIEWQLMPAAAVGFVPALAGALCPPTTSTPARALPAPDVPPTQPTEGFDWLRVSMGSGIAEGLAVEADDMALQVDHIIGLLESRCRAFSGAFGAVQTQLASLMRFGAFVALRAAAAARRAGGGQPPNPLWETVRRGPGRDLLADLAQAELQRTMGELEAAREVAMPLLTQTYAVRCPFHALRVAPSEAGFRVPLFQHAACLHSHTLDRLLTSAAAPRTVMVAAASDGAAVHRPSDLLVAVKTRNALPVLPADVRLQRALGIAGNDGAGGAGARNHVERCTIALFDAPPQQLCQPSVTGTSPSPLAPAPPPLAQAQPQSPPQTPPPSVVRTPQPPRTAPATAPELALAKSAPRPQRRQSGTCEPPSAPAMVDSPPPPPLSELSPIPVSKSPIISGATARETDRYPSLSSLQLSSPPPQPLVHPPVGTRIRDPEAESHLRNSSEMLPGRAPHPPAPASQSLRHTPHRRGFNPNSPPPSVTGSGSSLPPPPIEAADRQQAPPAHDRVSLRFDDARGFHLVMLNPQTEGTEPRARGPAAHAGTPPTGTIGLPPRELLFGVSPAATLELLISEGYSPAAASGCDGGVGDVLLCCVQWVRHSRTERTSRVLKLRSKPAEDGPRFRFRTENDCLINVTSAWTLGGSPAAWRPLSPTADATDRLSMACLGHRLGPLAASVSVLPTRPRGVLTRVIRSNVAVPGQERCRVPYARLQRALRSRDAGRIPRQRMLDDAFRADSSDSDGEGLLIPNPPAAILTQTLLTEMASASSLGIDGPHRTAPLAAAFRTALTAAAAAWPQEPWAYATHALLHFGGCLDGLQKD